MMYQEMYKEFGRTRVGRRRRELTAEKGQSPNYIELYAALALDAGWSTPLLDARASKVLQDNQCKSGQMRLL